MIRTTATFLLVLLAVSAVWGQDSRPSSRGAESKQDAEWRKRTRKADWPEDAPGTSVMPMKMLPITKAPYSRPGEMKNRIHDDDLVIGLEVGGKARAYPILMLGGPSREIINDRFEDEPYVVNW